MLSKETHDQSFMEEEIRRYTTLSYRAPEMIDLFSGVPISNFFILLIMCLIVFYDR